MKVLSSVTVAATACKGELSVSSVWTTRWLMRRAATPAGQLPFSRAYPCGWLTSSSTTRLYRGRAPRQERLTNLRAATHETELGDHGFCFSRSHYTDTDPTSRERAATAGIEPGSSSPGVARSTAELPRPPIPAETTAPPPACSPAEPQ